MKRFGSELELIGRIRSDGTTIDPVDTELSDAAKHESFKLLRLSITKDTYIASGFNSFVVKLKNHRNRGGE